MQERGLKMFIYYKRNSDTYMLKKDLREELWNELGIKIEPDYMTGKLSQEQEKYLEFILDEFIDDYFDVLEPSDLIENGEGEILDELGIDYEEPEYREQEGLFHNFMEGGNTYGD
jgi:hypothetical protein